MSSSDDLVMNHGVNLLDFSEGVIMGQKGFLRVSLFTVELEYSPKISFCSPIIMHEWLLIFPFDCRRYVSDVGILASEKIFTGFLF